MSLASRQIYERDLWEQISKRLERIRLYHHSTKPNKTSVCKPYEPIVQYVRGANHRQQNQQMLHPWERRNYNRNNSREENAREHQHHLFVMIQYDVQCAANSNNAMNHNISPVLQVQTPFPSSSSRLPPLCPPTLPEIAPYQELLELTSLNSTLKHSDKSRYKKRLHEFRCDIKTGQ